jgi:hypothetical protein
MALDVARKQGTVCIAGLVKPNTPGTRRHRSLDVEKCIVQTSVLWLCRAKSSQQTFTSS